MNVERRYPQSQPYNVSVLTPEETLGALRQELPGAQRANLLFLTAVGGQGTPLEELTSSLSQVEGPVRLAVSGSHRRLFPKGYARVFPLFNPKNKEGRKADKQQRKATQETYDHLEASGNDTKVVYTRAFGFPAYFFGISNHVHSKMIQVDKGERGVISVLPEFNLEGSHRAVNYALWFEENREQSDRPNSIGVIMADYFKKIQSHTHFRDYETSITDELLFLADAGRPGRSLIRDKAVSMFVEDTTEDIVFVSQFPPAGAILHAMAEKADQGANVIILMPENCRNGLPAKVFQRQIKGRNAIQPVYYPGAVHSKLALVNTGIRITSDNGVKAVTINEGTRRKGIASSNNLHPAGYMGGTGEIGFQIEDQELLEQIVGKVAGNINEALHAHR